MEVWIEGLGRQKQSVVMDALSPLSPGTRAVGWKIRRLVVACGGWRGEART